MFFPHTLADITRSVDGGLGLIAADLPDGSIQVLKRNRRTGLYTLTHWKDAARSAQLAQETFADRTQAVNAMAHAIDMPERM